MFRLIFLFLISGAVFAQSTDRIIVKFKNMKHSALRVHISNDKMATMQSRIGAKMQFKRQMFNGAALFQLSGETSIDKVKRYAKELSKQSDIEYAQPDYRKFPAAYKDEPKYGDQWYLHNALISKRSAINLEAAWNLIGRITSPAEVIVAIVDSGYLPDTPELNNQYIGGTPLSGYDFIIRDGSTGSVSSNDGDGRDHDPEDTGDGFTKEEYLADLSLLNCYGEIKKDTVERGDDNTSSWHGIFVAGIVAAENNNKDIVGVNPEAKILPVRVLGRCGGYTTDIADAIRWAAGLEVQDAPANPFKAKVINLSLGSLSQCSGPNANDQHTQDAINDAFNSGSVIVVAAGNEGEQGYTVEDSSPANCNNVLTVGAVTRGGAETTYTNPGEAVDISAPGGSGSLDSNKILSLSNSGLQTQGSPILKYEVGTSFSTPIVAGVASLMLSMRPDLTPSQIMGTIKATSRTFPSGTLDGSRDCTVANCGEGMLDAEAALIAVRDNNLTEDYNNPSSSNNLSTGLTRVTSSGSINYYFLGWFLVLLKLRRVRKRG